jgi:hypothetical protein
LETYKTYRAYIKAYKLYACTFAEATLLHLEALGGVSNYAENNITSCSSRVRTVPNTLNDDVKDGAVHTSITYTPYSEGVDSFDENSVTPPWKQSWKGETCQDDQHLVKQVPTTTPSVVEADNPVTTQKKENYSIFNESRLSIDEQQLRDNLSEVARLVAERNEQLLLVHEEDYTQLLDSYLAARAKRIRKARKRNQRLYWQQKRSLGHSCR